MLTLDHIAVLGETLEEAVAHAEAALGVPLQPGGKHQRFGTHNRVIGLGGGIYLEAIAIDPAAPPPDRPRWFGMDDFRGPARLDKWICAVPDMAAALAVFPEAGSPIELQRGDLRWTMAVPEDGRLAFDGLFPALIQWHGSVPPGKALPSQGCRLQTLEVLHPAADQLAARLAPHFSDARVRFTVADSPDLRATLNTARGPRVLT
ncbi:VOC family protein [Aestuariicoccus sp. MJ-SS9]|uniref:VOC family protein n=1 Tax=Aestuariicoccus sp. MJ-SS9 TaxID=3079855 RepID=UPI0029121408|nr:VOC family protein [Aestuariicoccus sp. MJ-SS9]MDU8913238.1 VOC family protein [Aestuariicoccus sp. MJ-SS9]